MRENITHSFGKLYEPLKAFVIYREPQDKNVYVEAFDMDSNGKPINAHPLSIQESISLAKALDTSAEMRSTFLEPEGLMPRNILYINHSRNAYVVWQTPAQKVRLLFKEDLTIPNGLAWIPPMIWKANRGSLSVYALNIEVDINENTPLCNAPFFNVYNDGKVCLGNVSIELPRNFGLEEFMKLWQTYFFNSFFSHTLTTNAVNGNIVQLWQKLIGTEMPFPLDKLIPLKSTLKDLNK